MVAPSLHVAPVDEVGAAAGDDLAAAHIHGDAHHAVRVHAARGRHHRGDLGAPCLRVEVRPAAALTVQLSLVVVGICRSTEGAGEGNQ